MSLTFKLVGVSQLAVGQAVQGPPQSTPFSPWFCIPSLQEAHAVQGPPQSTPASPWF